MMGPRRRAALIAGGSLLAAAELWAPGVPLAAATGFGDWQFFHHMWEAGFVALTRYHEWPLWDPYHCGGITILGNPQSQHVSPLFRWRLLAGPTLGDASCSCWLHAWAGFAGMYLFARAGTGCHRAGACSLAGLGLGVRASSCPTAPAGTAPFCRSTSRRGCC